MQLTREVIRASYRRDLDIDGERHLPASTRLQPEHLHVSGERRRGGLASWTTRLAVTTGDLRRTDHGQQADH
jgi:hypothetical protein